MTDDNIVSFSDAVVKKSQRNTPHITDTYHCFTDKMVKTKPADEILTKSWSKDWAIRALAHMPKPQADQVLDDQLMINMLLSISAPLARLLSASLWFSAACYKDVIFSDCATEADIVDYPAPLATYVFGKGCLLSARYHVFDFEMTADARKQASIANASTRNVTISPYLLDRDDVYNVYHPILVRRLLEAFHLESLAAQRGYEIIEVNDTLALRFSHPVGLSRVISWTLTIDHKIYDVM